MAAFGRVWGVVSFNRNVIKICLLPRLRNGQVLKDFFNDFVVSSLFLLKEKCLCSYVVKNLLPYKVDNCFFFSSHLCKLHLALNLTKVNNYHHPQMQITCIVN